MCGRAYDPESAAMERFWSRMPSPYRVLDPPPPRRYNIAPSQPLSVIRPTEDGDQLESMRWGLIPFWAKDSKIGYSTFNARAETLRQKPAFRAAFKARRCVIPLGGFYEWQRQDGNKIPWCIYASNDEPLLVAGLWEDWVDKDSGESLRSCTIVTCEPNATIASIHNRMPVILTSGQLRTWLEATPDEAAKLMTACNDQLIDTHPVSSEVNNARHDGPQLLDRI